MSATRKGLVQESVLSGRKGKEGFTQCFPTPQGEEKKGQPKDTAFDHRPSRRGKGGKNIPSIEKIMSQKREGVNLLALRKRSPESNQERLLLSFSTLRGKEGGEKASLSAFCPMGKVNENSGREGK